MLNGPHEGFHREICPVCQRSSTACFSSRFRTFACHQICTSRKDRSFQFMAMSFRFSESHSNVLRFWQLTSEATLDMQRRVKERVPTDRDLLDKYDRCGAHYRMFSNIPYDYTFCIGQRVTLFDREKNASRVHLIPTGRI